MSSGSLYNPRVTHPFAACKLFQGWIGDWATDPKKMAVIAC